MKKISGYTTSRNTLSMDYPLKECVSSLLGFCDEVIVFDTTDIEDGTRDLLNDLQKSDKRIKVYHEDWDYSVPNSGILDGASKAKARSLCSLDSEWLFQIDNDEIIHENDYSKIKPLIEQIDKDENINILALPVIEGWNGFGEGQIRIDVNPWKERISRNNPNFTHGIPNQLKKYENGLLYANGSDGCNMIYKSTEDPITIVGFMREQDDKLRRFAMRDERYVPTFENWFNEIINELPPIWHYSWASIERKIKTYKQFWNRHWKALYNQELNDKNPFFNKSFSEVSDEEIKQKAQELANETVGHVFHSSFLGQRNNGISVHREPPATMKEWMERNK